MDFDRIMGGPDVEAAPAPAGLEAATDAAVGTLGCGILLFAGFFFTAGLALGVLATLLLQTLGG